MHLVGFPRRLTQTLEELFGAFCVADGVKLVMIKKISLTLQGKNQGIGVCEGRRQCFVDTR